MIDGRELEKLEAKFRTLEQNMAADFSGLWGFIGAAAQQKVADVWDTQGYGTWPTDTDAYERWQDEKRRRTFNESPMIMRDNLVMSLLSPHGSHEFSVWKETPAWFEYGTKATDPADGAAYPSFLQEGNWKFMWPHEWSPEFKVAAQTWAVRKIEEVFG